MPYPSYYAAVPVLALIFGGKAAIVKLTPLWNTTMRTSILSLYFIIFVSYACQLAAETVYKRINKDGSIQYADKPFKGAKPLQLKDISQQSRLPAYKPPQPQSDVKKTITTDSNAHINILSPSHGETIRNNQGNITVMVQSHASALTKTRTQVLVNNILVSRPTQASVIQLKNIQRGELKIKAQLISSSGKILATSTETVVYLHRASVSRGK